jgi:hypothetical protein
MNHTKKLLHNNSTPKVCSLIIQKVVDCLSFSGKKNVYDGTFSVAVITWKSTDSITAGRDIFRGFVPDIKAGED